MDLTGDSGYWRDHPVVTNLVTDGVLVLAVVFGLDRVLAARARRRWRPLGLLVAQEFDMTAELPEAIACRVYDYCRRVYGTADIPEHMRYPDDILPLALGDPETWEGDEWEGLPDLVEEAEMARDTLEERIVRWAPVVIDEPELAAIAVSATRLLPVASRLVVALRRAHYRCEAQVKDDRDRELFEALFRDLDESERREFDLWDSIALYRTGQLLQPWFSKPRAGSSVTEEWA